MKAWNQTTMEAPSEQQNGWKPVPIKDIAEINPKLDKSAIPDKLMVSFVPMRAVGASDGTIDVSNLRPATEVKNGFTNFREGDVLFAKITPCMENGKMAVVPKVASGYGFGSTEFHVLRPKDGNDPRYLYYFVSSQSVRKEAAHNMTGAVGQKRVSTSYIADLEIPLAPPDQQRLIVAEVEKQFSRLDDAIANLKRVKANLKRYKAAVLKAAVEGKLTEEWRKIHPDVESASELLKHTLAERKKKWVETELAKMKAKGKQPKDDSWKTKYQEPPSIYRTDLGELPKSWAWSTIGQVVECLDSMRVPVNKKERSSRQGSIPYYGANGQVGWIDEFLYNEPLILVVEDETFTGREIPFSYKITGKSWVNNHAHVLRNTLAVDLEYLNYSLMYYPFTALTTGTTGRKKLTQGALLEAAYRLPPYDEQIAIVKQIESSLSINKEVESSVDVNLLRAEHVRHAILGKAFRGNLL